LGKGTPILFKTDVPISQLTTFQTSGTVSRVVELQSVTDACDFIGATDPLTYSILGRGSNTLINPDSPIQTIVRVAADTTAPERVGNCVRLGAGMPMKRLQDFAIEHCLSGLEFAAGVPASLGGMIAMNFGCWGRTMSDFVTAIDVVDETGTRRWITAGEAEFSYRHSVFHRKKWLVLGAEMMLTPSNSDEIKLNVQSNIQTRLEKQPLRDKTFGSIFKNPEGRFAAQLLEKAGVKGKRWGDIQLSDRHSNFLLNLGAASFAETTAVLHELKEAVKLTSGIELELEVRII